MGQKQEIIVKIMKKVIKKNGKKFPVYTGLTSLGNWFDLKFDEKVVKPQKSTVFIIKPEHWQLLNKMQKDEDGEYTINVLNKKGEKVKVLYIEQLDEELTEDDARYPESLRYTGVTQV